ncbi:MAG: hypothetical protein FJY56_12185 [Betaproteobacteria bacterium]|nr:hypothetical protein [Betaproteobacteria bacterium]
MSYEICALDPALGTTQEAATQACDTLSYWPSSRPDHERDARKWQISDTLLKFNPDMLRMDATAPAGGGWVSKLKGEAPEERRYLAMSLPHGDAITNFTVFDQAVEVEFAYDADIRDARAIVEQAWRHLRVLAELGFNTLVDTERNVLIDLNTDFDTVLRGYIANLKHDAEIDAADADAQAQRATNTAGAALPGAAPPRPASADQPFTGNVEAIKKKPWWKF